MKVGWVLSVLFLCYLVEASPAELRIPFLGIDTTTAPVFSEPEVAFYHAQLLTGECTCFHFTSGT